MFKEERFQKILDEVEKNNKVGLDELSQQLHVSTDTIRRDIKELSEKGVLTAVRGGAVHRSPLPPHFKQRQNLDVHEKKIIAQKILQFIKPEQVILIDAGTTTTAATLILPKDIPLTVVTNSFPVAAILEDFLNVEVIFLGGVLNKRAYSTNGTETIEAIKNIRADLCLLGICSIDLSDGITGSDYNDALVKKAMIASSKYVIALAAYEKIGTSCPYFISKPNAIDVFITEKAPAASDVALFENAGIMLR